VNKIYITKNMKEISSHKIDMVDGIACYAYFTNFMCINGMIVLRNIGTRVKLLAESSSIGEITIT
jgi:hypothetical protein